MSSTTCRGSESDPTPAAGSVGLGPSLGYVVNGLARSLRLQHSPVIGLISDEVLTTPFAAAMVLGAVETAARLGWMVMMTNTGVDRAAEAAEIQALQERQVAAFLYVRMYHQTGRHPGGRWRAVSDGAGGWQLRRRADRLGGPGRVRRRVRPRRASSSSTGTSGSPSSTTSTTSRPRGSGWPGSASELRRAGVKLPSPHVRDGETLGCPRAGYRAARTTARICRQRPEAVFCFNDRVAMGVYQAAHQRGSGHTG